MIYYYDFLSLTDLSIENKNLTSLNVFGGKERGVLFSGSIVAKN